MIVLGWRSVDGCGWFILETEVFHVKKPPSVEHYFLFSIPRHRNAQRAIMDIELDFSVDGFHFLLVLRPHNLLAEL